MAPITPEGADQSLVSEVHVALGSSFWRGRRVLIAGGAGFIGSYLVELVTDAGAHVTVVDNLARGRLDNLSSAAGDVRFVELDLRYREKTAKVCRGHDIILNLAAPVAGVQYSSQHHSEMMTDTLLINSSLIEASKNAELFLYCSSSCVYPDDAPVPTPETYGMQGRPELANEGYGWGKRMAELQTRFFGAQYGVRVGIGRPFNAYGPREYPEAETSAHVIPALIARILAGANPLVVWGTGEQTRSFVHARDFALGLGLITEKAASGEPINVGHDQETSLRDLVDLLLELMGEDRDVIFDPSKPVGAPRKAADVTLLKLRTGFVPRTPLRSGLYEMIEFLRAQGEP